MIDLAMVIFIVTAQMVIDAPWMFLLLAMALLSAPPLALWLKFPSIAGDDGGRSIP